MENEMFTMRLLCRIIYKGEDETRRLAPTFPTQKYYNTLAIGILPFFYSNSQSSYHFIYLKLCSQLEYYFYLLYIIKLRKKKLNFLLV